MFDPTKHIVHLTDGRLPTNPSPQHGDVGEIVAAAVSSKNPIVIHFHGGLVSEASARETAQKRLHPLYADRARAYPVYFVWEAGFFEAPLNNLHEIARESLFQQVVKKAALWALKKLPIGAGLRGTAGGPVDRTALDREFDEFFAGDRPAPPNALERVEGVDERALIANTKGVEIDEDALIADIEDDIAADELFKETVQEVHNGLHPAETRPLSRGGGTDVSTASLISKEAADELFPAPPGVTKGFGPIAWYKVAKAVAQIVIRVVRRLRAGRGHGTYVTIVEETLRQLYIDKIGRIGWWDRMKTDTADAFRPGPQFGGTRFLTELHTRTQQLPQPPRIVLVGHSTGAVYICNFLTAASEIAPNLRFDVIFHAPAVTHDMFAKTIMHQGSRITNFRQFGMSDEREIGDHFIPVVYLSSLLYFVSGMLESEPDEPLLGMRRFLDLKDVYTPGAFPSVQTCREFFARFQNAELWSPCAGGPGLECDSKKHGAFDDEDAPTMRSVEHILQTGF